MRTTSPMHWIRFAFVLGCLCSALAAVPARAWPPGAVAVCSAPGDQIDLVAIADGAGGVFAAWADPRSGDYDVYLQHLDASGEPAPGYPFDGLLVGDGVGNQLAPQIALDTNGDCWVAWKDVFGAVLRRRSVAAPLPPGFVPGGEAVTRPLALASTQFAICVVSPGQLFVLYAPGSSGSGIQMARMVSGLPQSFTVGSVDASNSGSLRVVPDGVGGAFAVWQRTKNPAIDLGVQRVSPGPVIAPGWPSNGAVLCSAAGAQESPEIVQDGEGGLYATWADRRAGNSDIYLTRITASGATPVGWPLDGVAVCSMTGTQAFPRLARTGAGGVLIVWEDTRGASTDIYAAAWGSHGARDPGWPANGGPISIAANVQLTPVIGPSSDGTAYLAWTTLQGGAAFDISVARAAAHGSSMPGGNGQLLSAAPNDQLTPIVVPGLAEDAIVLWQDFRDGGADYYAQRVALLAPLEVPGTGAAATSLRIRPQPARAGVAQLEFALADDTPATVELVDLSGRRVQPPLRFQGRGQHTHRIGSVDLAPGLYLARLEHAGQTRTARVVVIR